MALLSGEVETRAVNVRSALKPGFRMALLSGEVETLPAGLVDYCATTQRSGWHCYPGKLKRAAVVLGTARRSLGFRMALLSGEVETTPVPLSADDVQEEVPDGFAIRGS